MRTSLRVAALALAGLLAVVPNLRAGDAPAPAGPGFQPLDLPTWVIRPSGAPDDQPWILVVDDPQCPYCMQLHLAFEKAREGGDAEIAKATVVRLPFPLSIHDQAVHVVEDAFCLEAASPGTRWAAAPYLDWLIVEPWKAEAGWKDATLVDLSRDGGLFDSRYDAHRVTASRRRDFLTDRARVEVACTADACGGDAGCSELCAAQASCRAACPAEGAPAPSAAGGEGAAAGRDGCLAKCGDAFVSLRYRQLARAHSDCLLAEGPDSAHGRTAASYAWAVKHGIRGTPTVFVGHPRIGFRELDDADDMAAAVQALDRRLAEARARLAATSVPAP